VYKEDGIHLKGSRVLLVSEQGGRYSFEGVKSTVSKCTWRNVFI